MKNKPFTLVVWIAAFLGFLVLSPLASAQQFWDGPFTTPDHILHGGSGTWDIVTTNWTDGTGSTNNVYDNGTDVIFSGAAGVVTLGSNITTNGAAFIDFSSDGYVVNPNGFVLQLFPGFTVDTGMTATINAPLTNSESGVAALTKNGAGTLILGGVNTYTGITTLNAGVLSISQDANLGTPPVEPVANQLTFNGGTLQTTASFTLNPNRGITLNVGAIFDVTGANVLTYNGVITGPGSLTKVDTGTLALGGANTYTGGTNISAGTLQMLPGSLLALGNVTIGPQGTLRFSGGFVRTATFQNDGLMLFDGALNQIVNVPIVGTGNLTMDGTGTLNLSSNNTYTGATTVSAGTLLAGSATAFSANSAFTVNSQLDLNGFSNTIGSLAGNGIVSNGGSANAILTIGTANTDTTFSGTLQDGNSALGLTKVGTGTLMLTGANTYTGGTTISGGTLQLGNGGTTGSIVGNVIDNGTLAFNRSDSVTFPGIISGMGDVVKLGTGTLTLPSINTYTGSTTVNSGDLIVDGSIASAQTLVNAGGFLGGHGTIGGNLVNNGIVGQVNSPGTLTVSGNYTQNAGGTLRIGVAGLAPGQHDLLAVNGHAAVAGTLQFIRLGTFNLQPGNQITFLTANNGVSGTFGTVQNGIGGTGTIVQVQVISLPNSVVLEGTQGSFTQLSGLTSNEGAVAKMLDSARGDPREAQLFAFLNNQPLSALPNDLNQIAPVQNTSFRATTVSHANAQISNLGGRMSAIRAGLTGFTAMGFGLPGGAVSYGEGLQGENGPEGKAAPPAPAPAPQNRWGVFFTGLGEFTDINSTPQAAGYNVNSGGFTAGVDYRLASFLAVGLTAGYSHTGINIDQNGGNIDVNSGQFGLYATTWTKGFYLDAAISGGPDGYNSHRNALQGSANGNTSGPSFNVLAAVGYDWTHGALTIGPTASFQFGYVGLNEFSESGSLAPLKFPNQNSESERTAFGAKATYDWQVGHLHVLPQLSAAWQHEYGDTAYSIVANLASGAGNSFTVVGPQTGRDSLLIGAGVSVLLNDRVSTYIYYDGEFARTNYLGNAVTAGVRVTF